MQSFATARMIDGQFPRVEHQASRLRGLSLWLRVDRVADEWRTLVFHVHTDLMSPSRMKVAQDECGAVRGIAEKHLVVSDRGAACGRRNDGHLLSIARIASNVGENGFARGHRRLLRDAEVDFIVGAIRKLLGEVMMRVVIFRHNQTAGGVFIESMHDAWSLDSADPRKLAFAVVEQGIDQGAIVIAHGGVHDHAWFFIDDDHVVILEKNLQRNFLGDRLRRHSLGDQHRDAITELDGISRLNSLVVAQNEFLADQFLNPRAREIAKTTGQPGIDAFRAWLIDRENHEAQISCTGRAAHSSRSFSASMVLR